jgi:hypothetical protein
MWKAEDYAEKFSRYKKKTVVVCSAGFEKRSVTLIKKIIGTLDDSSVCVVMQIHNKGDPNESDHQRYQQDSLSRIEGLAKEKGIESITLHGELLDDKGQPSDNTKMISDLDKILSSESTRILVDISSFPRAVMFPLLSHLYDRYRHNELVVGLTENESEKQEYNDNYDYTMPTWMQGFEGVFSEKEDHVNVWIPILGQDKRRMTKVLESFPFKTIFPFIGFPSPRPRDTDLVAKEHRDLFEQYEISLKDVLYSPVADPFLLYLRIERLMGYLMSVPEIKTRTHITISPFGTKSQSLGAFLCGKLLKTGILYTQPVGYKSVVGDEGNSYIYYLRGRMYGTS